MWQKFVFLAFLVSLSLSHPTNRILAASDNAECSQNASAAYVDINILIDTSSNMGAANLRKIVTALSLALPKFPIGNQYDISMGQRNTRIAIVTFDDTATIVGNYTDINSMQDVTRILNAITIKNTTESNLYDALNKAMYIHTNCSDVLDDGCTEWFYYMRPTAMIVFAAAANSASVQLVPELVNTVDFFDDGTPISVNFNPTNSDITDLLNLITYNQYVNSSMYNFLGSSNTLTRDLEWAILQANCYCGDDWGTNTYQFNSTLNRWQKNAECMILSLVGDDPPTTPIELCDIDKDLELIPGFILTADRETWLENNLFQFPQEIVGRKKRNTKNLVDPDLGTGTYPFYFGLHLNNQNVWSWWNYGHNATQDTSFKASYFNWASGYPKAGDNCAIVDSDDGQHLVWKSYSCDPSSTELTTALCQAPACDATDIACCADCYYCQLNPDCGIFPKKKSMKKRSKKSRLIRKVKKVNGRYVRVD